MMFKTFSEEGFGLVDKLKQGEFYLGEEVIKLRVTYSQGRVFVNAAKDVGYLELQVDAVESSIPIAEELDGRRLRGKQYMFFSRRNKGTPILTVPNLSPIEMKESEEEQKIEGIKKRKKTETIDEQVIRMYEKPDVSSPIGWVFNQHKDAVEAREHLMDIETDARYALGLLKGAYNSILKVPQLDAAW